MKTLLTFFFATFIFSSANAQISESFEDQELFSNPTWMGDTGHFKINSSAQLQLNRNGFSDNSVLYTSTGINWDEDWQWTFYIKQSFAGSASNNSKIYFCAGLTDSSTIKEGYYLQFGEAGSSDAIRLFKQSNLETKEILHSDSSSIANGVNLYLRVLRKNNGHWLLYSAAGTNGPWSLLAEGNEEWLFNANAWLFELQYTSSNATKFYFDDISSGPFIADTVAPKLLSVQAISGQEVRLTWDEEINSNSALNKTNYLLFPSGNYPDTVISNNNNYVLHFANAFVNDSSYRLQIKNSCDINDNCSSPDSSYQFTYQAGQAATLNELIINEIYADNSSTKNLTELNGKGEFIEVFNASDKSISLSNYRLTVGSKMYLLEFTELISPQEYFIICKKTDSLFYSSFAKVITVNNTFSILNEGTSILLHDPFNTLVDSISFKDSWHESALKKDGAYSLERINPYNSCAYQQQNWTSCRDSVIGASPGKQNSVYQLTNDNFAPTPVKVRVLNASAIYLELSEPMIWLPGEESSFFTILDDQGTMYTSITGISNDVAGVKLNLFDALQSGNNYYLTIKNIRDCHGNQLQAEHNLAFGLYKQPSLHEVLITEVMADPSPTVALPEAEYIELYNRSEKHLSLFNCKLVVGSSYRILPEIILEPGQWITLTAENTTSLFQGKTYGLPSFPSLTNEGAIIYLEDSLDQLIHAMQYDSKSYKNALKENGGWSLELIDINQPCLLENNWSASEHPSGGSPSKINSINNENNTTSALSINHVTCRRHNEIHIEFNHPIDPSQILSPDFFQLEENLKKPDSVKLLMPLSQELILYFSDSLKEGQLYHLKMNTKIYDCSGNQINEQTLQTGIPSWPQANEIYINEVMFDSNADFIELFNASTNIIDLHALQFCYQQGSPISISDVTRAFMPGQYLALGKNKTDLLINYPRLEEKNALEVTGFPELRTDDATLVIQNKNQLTLDSVIYSPAWHHNSLTETKGVSLERISIYTSGTSPENWHSAASSVLYSTPGEENSQQLTGITNDEVLIYPQIFSPDMDGYNDYLVINCSFANAGEVVEINIFNSNGQWVKRLKSGQFLASEEKIIWDGTDDKGRVLPMGIYIVYVKTIPENENNKQFRKTVVLAKKI